MSEVLGVSEEMEVSELLELPEVIRCVLLCTLEAVEDRLISIVAVFSLQSVTARA